MIFRFYPRRSHCHSFGEEPPKSWSDVYKVYYSYAIIQQSKFDPDNQWESEIVFSESCDECSVIDEIAERCLLLNDGYKTFERGDGERIPLLEQEIFPFGMGTSWIISETKNTYYNFTLFNYWNKGYRFTVKEEHIGTFGKYLKSCCEYMLAHGESI